MVAVHYAGNVEDLYPEIKIQPVQVTLAPPDRTGRNKAPINGVVHGEMYYIPPSLFAAYKVADGSPLTTPFVKALPPGTGRQPVVNENDLCHIPLDDLNKVNSVAALMGIFYEQFIRTSDMQAAKAHCILAAKDFGSNIVERLRTGGELIYVFDPSLFRDYHISTRLKSVEFEVFDSNGNRIAPMVDGRYDVCPNYDRVFVTMVSGKTPLKYEVFFHMAGDRPDLDFIRVEIEEESNAPASLIYLDDKEHITAITSTRLYSDILKSPLKDCIARYVNARNCSPLEIHQGGYEPMNVLPPIEVTRTAGRAFLKLHLNIHDGEAASYVDYVLRNDALMAEAVTASPLLTIDGDNALVSLPKVNPFITS